MSGFPKAAGLHAEAVFCLGGAVQAQTGGAEEREKYACVRASLLSLPVLILSLPAVSTNAVIRPFLAVGCLPSLPATAKGSAETAPSRPVQYSNFLRKNDSPAGS